MSIVAYTGLPGSGKSYGVVENVIIPALDAGRTVWTNVPMRMEAVRDRWPDADIELFDAKTISERPEWLLETVPAGVVFVFDEVAKIWKQGAKASTAPQPWIDFLAEHRHRVGESGYSQEIILIMQDLSQTATFVRDLIEKTYISKKLDAIGASKKYVVQIFDGAIKGASRPDSRLINKIVGTYKPEVYALYQSHTQSETGSAGIEKKADKRGLIWHHPMIKFGMPLMLVLLLVGIWKVKQFFDPASHGAGASVAQKTGPKPEEPPPRVERAKPVRVVSRDSTQWRLAGFITGSSGYERAFIVSKDVTRLIGTASCDKFEDTGERFCFVDGKRVTRWTAPETLASKESKGGFMSMPSELTSAAGT